MPRPGPRRPQLPVRISPAALDLVDTRAAELAVTRSEVVRRMLSYAARNMTPRDWSR